MQFRSIVSTTIGRRAVCGRLEPAEKKWHWQLVASVVCAGLRKTRAGKPPPAVVGLSAVMSAWDSGDDDSLRLPMWKTPAGFRSHGGAAHAMSLVLFVGCHPVAAFSVASCRGWRQCFLDGGSHGSPQRGSDRAFLRQRPLAANHPRPMPAAPSKAANSVRARQPSSLAASPPRDWIRMRRPLRCVIRPDGRGSCRAASSHVGITA